MNLLFCFSTLALLLTTTSTVWASDYKYVPELDLTQYDGFWYEVYSDAFDQTFQRGGSCVTADYTLLENGTVDVLNKEIYLNGTETSIAGTAYYDNGNSGGELTVELDGTPAPAPYWVVELGPIVNDDYDYAIVSDNLRISLFVLARDIDRFFELYDEDVLDSVEEMGFTRKYNSPIVVNQTYCEYR
jgi:apolipoprotein D and lipocalin family protein